MEHARIFLVEPDMALFKMLKMMLEKKGHRVVLEARSPRSALEAAKQVKGYRVQLAIVDSFVQNGSATRSWGSSIVSVIRKVDPAVVIIAFTADYVESACVWIPKGGSNIKSLLKTIAEA